MIVYAVDTGGQYITPEESLRRHPEGKRSLYVNLTNACNAACQFCLRPLKNMPSEHSLWLHGKEPSVAEVESALQKAPWDFIGEVVFCGFGEPTLRLEALVTLLKYVKQNFPDHPTRLNTNGLSDLQYERDTSQDFQGGILDVASISLNASNAQRYQEITRTKFGERSFEAMLQFAQHLSRYVPDVVLTVVDHVEDAEEIAKCRALVQERGLRLRVRTYEAN